MRKRQIVCDNIDAVGPYSVAMQVGPAVLVSGQLPLDKEGNLVSDDIAIQTTHVIKQIENILKSVDMTLDHVVKTTVYLIDLEEFKEVNRAYAIYFGHPYPVRSCIEVAKLPQNARIKIECVAVDAQTEEEEDCAGCCCE
ncbi:MAG TPA: Rid family detoxifying hydrolase [Erysipelothrix sp.]